MYEKDLNIPMLLDFYGELLTEKQRDTMLAYYEDDMSLGEIALQNQITRQGVRDSIKRGEEQLRNYEERLGLVARMQETLVKVSKIKEKIEEIKEINSKTSMVLDINSRANDILSTIDEISY
ncbi:MAG: DNA-binding protein [Clostridia bacterium]|nr:DNA-binding protein [Clostridia bacterium]MBR2328136.1 DNA-binding protein [Clostridia bacterium]